MNFLVDTNVYSEITRREPDGKVVQWLKTNEPNLYTTTITLGELKYGINRLDGGDEKNFCRLGSQASPEEWTDEYWRSIEARNSLGLTFAVSWSPEESCFRSRMA